MKPWTRTLNLDDAHTLLALAEVGRPKVEWVAACHDALPELSMARRRELIRLLRDGFLQWQRDGRIAPGLFLTSYEHAPATAQIDLVQAQWAMTHPLSLVAVDTLVAPRQVRADQHVPLDDVDELVTTWIDSGSSESRRKTRTVLLAALEGVGALATRGTGVHRSLWASRGRPHPLAYGYLVRRECADRGLPGLGPVEAVSGSVAQRLTQCLPEHAEHCVSWCLQAGALSKNADGLLC